MSLPSHLTRITVTTNVSPMGQSSTGTRKSPPRWYRRFVQIPRCFPFPTMLQHLRIQRKLNSPHGGHSYIYFRAQRFVRALHTGWCCQLKPQVDHLVETTANDGHDLSWHPRHGSLPFEFIHSWKSISKWGSCECHCLFECQGPS
jgi:hypothetical protein